MKVWFYLCVCTLLQMYSSVLSQDCITLFQFNTATNILCRLHRNNKELWQKVIDCHRPIDDQFLRESSEARCPSPKYVQDPTNLNYTIQDVFLNACGLVDGNALETIATSTCVVFGKTDPYIMSQSVKTAAVKAKWGNDVPCNIGKCILALPLLCPVELVS